MYENRRSLLVSFHGTLNFFKIICLFNVFTPPISLSYRKFSNKSLAILIETYETPILWYILRKKNFDTMKNKYFSQSLNFAL